jgi:hypothetical protein
MPFQGSNEFLENYYNDKQIYEFAESWRVLEKDSMISQGKATYFKNEN